MWKLRSFWLLFCIFSKFVSRKNNLFLWRKNKSLILNFLIFLRNRKRLLQLLRIFLKSLKIDRVSLDLYSSPETRNILYGFVTSKTISNDWKENYLHMNTSSDSNDNRKNTNVKLCNFLLNVEIYPLETNDLKNSKSLQISSRTTHSFALKKIKDMTYLGGSKKAAKSESVKLWLDFMNSKLRKFARKKI